MDVNQAISDISKKQRNLLLVVILGLVVLGGVWTAIWVERRGAPQVQEGSEDSSAIITEITLAGLHSIQEETKENPVLRQKTVYQTGEPLALRITTAEGVREPVEVSVRLLDPNGGIHDLSPSSATFQPGTSTFCCWRISEPGKFTLQIFRPERVVTTIPITVQGTSTSARPLAP